MTNEKASVIMNEWLRKGTDGMTKERLGFIESWFHESDAEAFNMAIQALDQIQWVSINDRLPSKDGDYLCSVLLINNQISMRIVSYADDLFKISNYDFYNKIGVNGWYEYDSEYGYFIVPNVVAWMSLPTPYREDGE